MVALMRAVNCLLGTLVKKDAAMAGTLGKEERCQASTRQRGTSAVGLCITTQQFLVEHAIEHVHVFLYVDKHSHNTHTWRV